jgi:transposase
VQTGVSISAAASKVGIKYTTARNIVDKWRKGGSPQNMVMKQEVAQESTNSL